MPGRPCHERAVGRGGQRNVLRDLLLTKLQELNEVDEVADTPAQFELFDRWTEREREPALAYA